MQRTFSVEIQNNDIDCLLSYDDTLLLSFSLYDTLGALISPPANYLFQWSNNLTSNLIIGVNAEFPLNLISDTVFYASNKIMFYLQMIDTSNNAIAALDSKYFYLNPDNTSSVAFNVYADSLSVQMEDIIISGNYNSISWDFEDGYIINAEIPPYHTYTSNGTYTITCTLQYGNYDYCEKAYAQTITPILYNYFKDSINFLMNNISNYSTIVHEKPAGADQMLSINLFPNPSNELVTVTCKGCYITRLIEVFNQEGKKVFSSSSITNGNFIIDSQNLPAGNYIMRMQTDKGTITTSFEIVR